MNETQSNKRVEMIDPLCVASGFGVGLRIGIAKYR